MAKKKENSPGKDGGEKKAVKVILPVKPAKGKVKGGKEGAERQKKMEDMSPEEVVDLIIKEETEGEAREEKEGFGGMSEEMKKRIIIMVVSLALGVIFFLLAASKTKLDIGINVDYLTFTMLGIMIMIGPISIYEHMRLSRITRIEERLADFLRDLGESTHAGLTLAKAIKVASKGEYGELTPEIRKMEVQISWGVPATEALAMFAERVNTPLVMRSILLVNEANEAGGDVSSVLAAAADDTREIQLLQNERSTQMMMYVATIFVAFVVFLVVILIVYKTFMPQMQAMQENLKSASAEGGGGATISVFQGQAADFDEITMIFVLSALVQGIGDGLVAGLMQTGRILNGLKYSFAMVLIVFVIYVFAM